MGKGRDARKKKSEQHAANKAAHERRVVKLAEIKAKKQGGAVLAADAVRSFGRATIAAEKFKDCQQNSTAGSSTTNNNNSKGKKGKGKKKTGLQGDDDTDDEDEEDIEAIIASFNREQEEKTRITEEVCKTPPSARANASLVSNPLNANELVLFGGEFYNGQKCFFYNDLYRYNIDRKEWRKISSPNSPGPRSSHQAVATPNGLMFVIGGEFASASERQFFHYRDFWVLDLKTNAWERLELQNKPSPRSGHRVVLWKQFLLLFGGFYDTIKETRYYDDLWAFDTSNYIWHKVAMVENTPKPSPRSGFCMFVYNDVLFLYGGYCKISNKGEKAKGVVHSDLWSVKLAPDLKGLRWERRKRVGLAPSPRSGLVAALNKNRVIFFGGVHDEDISDEQMHSVFYNEMYILQLDSARWFPLTLRGPKKPKTKTTKGTAAVRSNKVGSVGSDSNSDSDSDKDDVAPDKRQQPEGSKRKRSRRNKLRSFPQDDVVPPENEPEQIAEGEESTLDEQELAGSIDGGAGSVARQEEYRKEDEDGGSAFFPAARFNAMLAVQRNVLYVYGGLVEQNDREFTLNDLYALNLDKLDKFDTLIAQPIDRDAYAVSSSSDDGDESEDEGDDDTDDDDDDDNARPVPSAPSLAPPQPVDVAGRSTDAQDSSDDCNH